MNLLNYRISIREFEIVSFNQSCESWKTCRQETARMVDLEYLSLSVLKMSRIFSGAV